MLIKYKKSEGFTIIEMIVSIAIVTVILSSVLINYTVFSDNLALSSAAQELAVTARQAQTYGLTVREVAPSGGRFDSAYGVYFNSDDPTNYYLFADLDDDKQYDSSSELIQKFILRNNVQINYVCNNSITCPPPAVVKTMEVTFKRPNPDANINFTVNGGGSTLPNTGKVVLISPKGKTLTITIESTGQVLVGDII